MRTPTPSHRDIALFFAAFALLILLLYIQGVVGRLPARPMTLATGTLAMLLPYLLLRVVTGFSQTPGWLVHLAEVGLLLCVAGLAVAPDPAPPWLVWPLAAYFVLLTGYDTYVFVREAKHSAGVTRRRVQAAAVASLALAAAVLVAVVASQSPGTFDVWTVLSRLLGITSGLAYYVAFTPPRWLRQSWQAPALQAYLSDITRLPYLPELEAVLVELERHAATIVGAPSAAIGLWQESEGVLRFWTGLGDRATLASYPADLAARGIV